MRCLFVRIFTFLLFWFWGRGVSFLGGVFGDQTMMEIFSWKCFLEFEFWGSVSKKRNERFWFLFFWLIYATYVQWIFLMFSALDDFLFYFIWTYTYIGLLYIYIPVIHILYRNSIIVFLSQLYLWTVIFSKL